MLLQGVSEVWNIFSHNALWKEYPSNLTRYTSSLDFSRRVLFSKSNLEFTYQFSKKFLKSHFHASPSSFSHCWTIHMNHGIDYLNRCGKGAPWRHMHFTYSFSRIYFEQHWLYLKIFAQWQFIPYCLILYFCIGSHKQSSYFMSSYIFLKKVYWVYN